MGRHSTRYPAEVRERAVRLVFEHQGEHGSQWAAMCSIADGGGLLAAHCPGRSQGREGGLEGRYDRDKLFDKPRKDIWLRPLRRDWKGTFNR